MQKSTKSNFKRIQIPILFVLIFLIHNNAFATDSCAQVEDAAAECTIPNDFDIDVTVSGNTTWSDLISDVDPDDITSSIRISGDGIITVEDKDVLLKSSDAMLVLEGVEFIVNNGNVLLDESGSRIILTETTFKVSGNVQLKEETFLCATNCQMEVGDEEVDGNFNDGGDDYTSANFQNDGGYRYLENVCLNVTQDYQLESSGDGTASGGGLDIWKNVCAEIGDAGNTNASDEDFGDKDGDDSGNFQNSNTMKIYDSEIVIANGNFQNESSSQMDLCNVGIKLNDGDFQNSGELNGTNLTLAIDGKIENDDSWSGDISNWYAGDSNSAPANSPSESSKSEIKNLFGDCDCMPASNNTVVPVPDAYETYNIANIFDNILTNDYDPEGDNIILTGVEDPNNPSNYVSRGKITSLPGINTSGNLVANAGTINIQPTGLFYFQPSAEFVGVIELNYEICDDNPNVACEKTTVTIVVKGLGLGDGFDLGRSEGNSNPTKGTETKHSQNIPIQINELKLMPNPVRKNQSLFVQVETLQESTQVRMLNMMGKVVKTINVDSIGKQKLELDVSDLSSGIYHVVIDGSQLMKKVVIVN